MAWRAGLLVCVGLVVAGGAPAQEPADPLAPTQRDQILGDGEALLEELEQEDLGPTPEEQLLVLLESLPRRRSSGREISPVLFLGVTSAPGIEGVLLDWLHPRRANLAELEAALFLAADREFPLVERTIPEALRGEREALLGGERERDAILGFHRELEVDAVLLAQVTRRFSLFGPLQIDAHLLVGRNAPAFMTRESQLVLVDGMRTFGAWNPRPLVPIALLIGLFVAARLRGKGELILEVDRGQAVDGVSFSGSVSRRTHRGKVRPKDVIDSRILGSDRTSFVAIPAGRYFVAVRRVVRDVETQQVESNHLEERQIAIRRNRKSKVRFELTQADHVGLHIEIVRGDEKVADQVLLKCEGDQEVRYVRNGLTSLSLPAGPQRLVVGHDDRAFRVPVKLEKEKAEVTLRVDLANDAKATFTGCPEAVAPFVQGDLQAAVDALDRAGHERPANLLRAEIHGARGELDKASEALEAAGKLEEAAQLRSRSGDAKGTARLLEQTGDFERAAQEHRRAGDLLAAARAFAQASRFGDAVDCALEAGDRPLAIEILEQKGDRLEAARHCLDLMDADRAIAILQGIGLHDPQYGEGSLILAQLFCEQGEAELALQKLDEAVDVFGSETSLELREQIARQLEQKGELSIALEAYEHIRKRDIRYPGMAEKISELRAQLAQPKTQVSTDGEPTPAAGDTVRTRSRYELEGEIGRGGMGVVYKARDRVLGRTVALKRLPESLKEHETAVKLFLREARAAAALNHQNIVTLFDAGQEGGHYYITMEFLQGHPVNELLEQRGRFRIRDAVRLSIQVAEGLAYAHDEGIVHRDIKPSNLFLTEKSRVKIMDFGLAKMMEEVRRNASIIAGTPYYMAPEQSVGGVVDHRADLYAFGVSIYEFVTGHVPFREGDVTYHHRHTPVPDPREEIPELPSDLVELVLGLLAKEPDDRVPSAGEVRQRLERLLQTLPR